MIEALLLAALLHRDPALVACVYDMGGLDAVVVVEYESQFNPRAWRREARGTSWGLFQLYSKCHEQYRDDPLLHIVAGVAFLKECEMRGGRVWARNGARSNESAGMPWSSRKSRDMHLGLSNFAVGLPMDRPSSLAIAYSIYNSGSPWASIEKGRAVQRKRDEALRWLWNHEGIAGGKA